ncbi:hypothetical protein C8J56DRAFT_1030387 [Mycena floridula]|nr:hypothetical protein C8J56DRAFT_1030387 [Mycena floridula]
MLVAGAVLAPVLLHEDLGHLGRLATPLGVAHYRAICTTLGQRVEKDASRLRIPTVVRYGSTVPYPFRPSFQVPLYGTGDAQEAPVKTRRHMAVDGPARTSQDQLSIDGWHGISVLKPQGSAHSRSLSSAMRRGLEARTEFGGRKVAMVICWPYFPFFLSFQLLIISILVPSMELIFGTMLSALVHSFWQQTRALPAPLSRVSSDLIHYPESLCHSYQPHRPLVLDVKEEQGSWNFTPELSLSDFERYHPLDVKVIIKSLCDSQQKHRPLSWDVKQKADHIDLRGLADTDHVARNVLAEDQVLVQSLASSICVRRKDVKTVESLGDYKPRHKDGRCRDVKTRGLAGIDQAECYVLAESTSLASFSRVRHKDVKTVESLGNYKPRSRGLADIDHVKCSVLAHEQVLVRSLASSINNSTSLVSHQYKAEHRCKDPELKWNEIAQKHNVALSLDVSACSLNFNVLHVKSDFSREADFKAITVINEVCRLKPEQFKCRLKYATAWMFIIS